MPNYKVVDADVLNADLQTVADAIKAKAGTEEALEFPSGFASAVESIEAGGGGDTAIEDGLITGTLTEYTNDRVESVKQYAFYGDNSLVSISFPKATSIGKSAFTSATKLKTVNLPLVTSFGDNAFKSCVALTTAYVQSLLTLYFSRCSLLQTVIAPSATSIATSAFYGCGKLEKLDLPSVVNISSGAFQTCHELKTIILRSNSVCSLSDSGSFSSTPFASGGTGGTVYVPAALIEQYQTATNWSILYAAGTCNFVAIEGSEYE